MRQYLDLLGDVLYNGVRKPTRAKLESTGTNVDAFSVFGRQIRFDLAEGFPLVTTKRVDFDAIAHELVWFLRGWTNVKYLQDHGIKIWDKWADANGDLGPVYGSQWRSWPDGRGGTIDQIADVVAGIRAVVQDPTASVGRRLVVTAWNPAEIADMALPPCHTLFQFMVAEGKLSCQLYQRSADLFLGVPYNIASYALLTHLVAHVAGLGVGEFVHTFGDAHVYTNHLGQVREQLERSPMPLPRVEIAPEVKDVTLVERDQVVLHGYTSHPALRGEVAV